MDVFLSHSASDATLAERLARGLDAHGLTVWLDSEELKPGADWQREIAEAVRSAEIAVLLVDRDSESDQLQQFTWQAILEAVWQDPQKRLVTVLKRDAQLPKFVRSASATAEVLVLRLEESPELGSAIEAIVELSEGRAPSPSFRGDVYRSSSVREESGGSKTGTLPAMGDEDDDDESDEDARRERLDYIERVLSMSRHGD